MALQLVSKTFRHASGQLARGVVVGVHYRDTGIEVASLITDQLGTIHHYFNPGMYDWIVLGARIPFDVIDSGGGTGGEPPYIHTQSSPASTWTVVHNRGTKPPVVIELAAFPGEAVYTDVTYQDLNTLIIELPSAASGAAYIQ